MTLRVVEVARVRPSIDSDSTLNSANPLVIPLTFFDLPWLAFHPVTRVFFYKLTDSTHDHFHSFILPKFKHSLSILLRNYLPLTGRITWDQNDPKPNIVVTQNDALSLTIAESDVDFSSLSSYGQRPVSDLHALIPDLQVSDDSATAFSLQITLFPNHGFSIGVAAHHAVLDGKTSTMFLKAWAHLCKQHLMENRVFSLPENLTPSFDRSLIKDLTGLDQKMIEIVRSLKDDKTEGRRSLSPVIARDHEDDVVLATFVFSRDDIERLRKRVINKSPPSELLHLSTFVVAYAYTWTCLVKARGGENGERLVSFLFSADFRERLDPPLPATYFGNCMIPAGLYNIKAETFVNEKGLLTAVEILSDLVKGLSSGKVETFAEEVSNSFRSMRLNSQLGTVAGSPRLGVYELDFGWGRPVKVDVLSIKGENISMAERRDEPGGVEIGMCMKKAEMDIVLSHLNNGLQI